MASMPKLRLGGPPSNDQPSPPSGAGIIRGMRSLYSSGTRSNTWGGSFMWQSADMTFTAKTLVPDWGFVQRRGSPSVTARPGAGTVAVL